MTDTAKPYKAGKEEVHPDALSDGRETVGFFQREFGLNGQETVALMRTHTFGKPAVVKSLFPYFWTSRWDLMFNKD